MHLVDIFLDFLKFCYIVTVTLLSNIADERFPLGLLFYRSPNFYFDEKPPYILFCIVGNSLHRAVCTATDTSYFPAKYNRLVTLCGKSLFCGFCYLR